MRGRTFKDCFVLLDEAQNTTRRQMKLFLTRLGEGARACVDGDSDQSDLQGPNGLDDALIRFQDVEGINCFRFTIDEVVRSELVKKIIKAYL
jgi:phosphate starvation-inducible PhoH-like protein